MNTKVNKVLKFFIEIFFIITIVFFAWSMTPKTFQNDTFYNAFYEYNKDNKGFS